VEWRCNDTRDYGVRTYRTRLLSGYLVQDFGFWAIGLDLATSQHQHLVKTRKGTRAVRNDHRDAAAVTNDLYCFSQSCLPVSVQVGIGLVQNDEKRIAEQRGTGDGRS
jgi:hypothetical protein